MPAAVLAPGARIECRNAEWLVRSVGRSSDGQQVVGVSPFLREKESRFLVEKDEAETSVLFELVPFSEWENVFSTSAMAVAAVDRCRLGSCWLASAQLGAAPSIATAEPICGRWVNASGRLQR
jgi:hypothetical protein